DRAGRGVRRAHGPDRRPGAAAPVRRRDRIQLPGRQRELRQRRLRLPVCELHLRRAAGGKRGRSQRVVAGSLLPARVSRRLRLRRKAAYPPMFEIGSALREARERRGLSYSQVEEGTKIRARYIRALEDEDFGVLPGATYSKGFLRAYADYLGLDGHLFIDEFNSRYHDPRNDDARPIYPPSRRTPSRPRRETSIVLIALAAIVAIASLVFLGAGSGGTPNTPLPTPSTT